MELWRDLLILIGAGAVGYLGKTAMGFSQYTYQFAKLANNTPLQIEDDETLNFSQDELQCIEGFVEVQVDGENGATNFVLKKTPHSVNSFPLQSLESSLFCGELKKLNKTLINEEINGKKVVVLGKLTDSNKAIDSFFIGNVQEDITGYINSFGRSQEIAGIALCSTSIIMAFFSNIYIPKKKVLFIPPFKITTRKFKDYFTIIDEITVEYHDKVYSQSPMLYRDNAHTVLITNGIISDSEYANEERMEENKLVLRYFSPRIWSGSHLVIRKLAQILSIGGITFAVFSLLDSVQSL